MNNQVDITAEEMDLLLMDGQDEIDGPMDVLIVGQDDGTGRQLKSLLTSPLFIVHVCDDAFKALNICKGIGFNLIIADYHMPGMNGVMFLSLVKKYQPKTYRFLLSDTVDTEILTKAINEAGSMPLFRSH